MAAAIASLLVVPASPPGRAGAADEPLDAAQDVLAAQVAAIASGDRAGFLATIDPRAPRAFRDAQLRRFDGLRSVPLQRYALRARTDQSGDLSAGVAAKYAPARVFLPHTQESLRLRGYDDRDAVQNLWFTFVERDGRWYLAADDDVRSVGLDTAKNLWDLGPVRVRETAHFLVLSRPNQADRADALASVAEDAATTLGQRWTAPWSRRVPLVVPGSIEELETMLQSTIDLDKFVAFAAYGYDSDRGYETTAPRVYVNDRNLSRYSRSGQVEVLLHELNHVAVAAIAGPATPLWVHEGIAESVAKPGASTRKPKGGDATLPRDYEFVSGSQAAIVRAYAEARSIMGTLVAIAGPGVAVALVTELGRSRVSAGNVDYRLDEALGRVARLRTADLEKRWAAGR